MESPLCVADAVSDVPDVDKATPVSNPLASYAVTLSDERTR